MATLRPVEASLPVNDDEMRYKEMFDAACLCTQRHKYLHQSSGLSPCGEFGESCLRDVNNMTNHLFCRAKLARSTASMKKQ